ncbi:hypothetical protein ACH4SK_39040 [Streptomyces inhibens]|uniref:hypothetical protein n=1 Tax=Streptomyces inhibens TaxID=2293571 RepID=UPI003791DDFE
MQSQFAEELVLPPLRFLTAGDDRVLRVLAWFQELDPRRPQHVARTSERRPEVRGARCK